MTRPTMLCGNLSVGGRIVLKRFLFPYLGVPVALSVVWLVVAVPVGDALEPDSLSSDRIYDLDCGRSLVDPPNGDVSLVQSVRVALAVDEEWRDLTIGSDVSSPRGVLLAAGSMFRGVGINLLAVSTLAWDSPDDADSVRGLIAAAEESIPRGQADIVVVLSAQPLATSEDGYSEVGGRYVVVAHHPEHPERDASVLAHEISHLFGAHHGCDVAGHDGLMAPAGFSDPNLICPCTRRILELNARRFHEVSR